MSGLTIYKASAGSGKTFQLTREFLQLALKPGTNFRNILAVTFTNKATAEMRERILKELYMMANGMESGHRNALASELGISPAEVDQGAANLLNEILHHYGRFSVSTIDKFFQRIIKTFTKELGLSSGFELELDFEKALTETVDKLFEQIDEDKELNSWLLKFSLSRLDQGKNWDVQRSVLSFCKDSFSESFLALDANQLEYLSKRESFEKAISDSDHIIKLFADRCRESGEKAYALMQQHGLTPEDFAYGKTGVGVYLAGLRHSKGTSINEPGKRARQIVDEQSMSNLWATKSSNRKNDIEACVASGLFQILYQWVQFYDEHQKTYHTAVVIRQNMEVFAVLSLVYQRLIDHCNENGIFLLSFATPLLFKMIGKDDAPFIYEKTGEHFHHFMIDEFQDTSQLQWMNFFPLFNNSLSQGFRSLVVGDVKQSIYRWRNSDWTLLHSRLDSYFEGFGLDHKTLRNNWRSAPQVVEFNNWCLQNMPRLAQGVYYTDAEPGNESVHGKMISEAYQDGSQEVDASRKDNQGYICVRFIQKSDKETQQQEAMEFVVDGILQLYEQGFSPADVAIIVRTNKEGSFAAQYLMDYRKEHPEFAHLLQFVSGDSLFLGSSQCVQLIVALLRYLLNPAERYYQAQCIKLYFSLTVSEQQALVHLEDWILEKVKFEELMPAFFMEKTESYGQQSLSKICDDLIRNFLWNSNLPIVNDEREFIYAFQDEVHQFVTIKGNDLTLFFDWWTDKGEQKAITMADNRGAIRIITIHKCKGLEYKAVFIPFADWSLEPKPSVIWAELNNEAYQNLKLIPVNYSKILAKTHFHDVYYREKALSYVDNLNLFYVAATRAKAHLYISAIEPSDSGKLSTVGHLLHNLISSTALEQYPKEARWNPDEMFFDLGKPVRIKTSKEPETQAQNISTHFDEGWSKLKIKLHNREFFTEEGQQLLARLNKGRVMHRIFENIRVTDDINLAINRVAGLGLIRESEKEGLSSEIRAFLAHPIAAKWFSPGNKVRTEAEILLATGELKRPDRIVETADEIWVIDYKFTPNPLKEHQKQVNEYVLAIEKLSPKKVKGFLWYVFMGDIVEL